MCTYVGVWGKWEDRVTCFLVLEKLVVCRRGKPRCLACPRPRPGLALRQVIEFNRMWLRTTYSCPYLTFAF